MQSLWMTGFILSFFYSHLAFSQHFWTNYISDEKGKQVATCGSPISGAHCRGRYCDNISLRCRSIQKQSSDKPHWTTYFSEESYNYRLCSPGTAVSGLKCKGRYCDEIALQCSPHHETNFRAPNCYWTSGISEEKGGRYLAPDGTWVQGVRCKGSFCDRKEFYLCQNQIRHCQDQSCRQKLAERFAPRLVFDRNQGDKNKCFPSDAGDYFQKRAQGYGGKICNEDYNTILQSEVPIYYQFQTCGSNTAVIYYWFFYGYQDNCAPGVGNHHADWESIAVRIDSEQLSRVRFSQHRGSYTKLAENVRFFETHPIVYVGKNSHGSYHDDGGSGNCLYFEDFRNPGAAYQHLDSWKNLVELTNAADSPTWMQYRGTKHWDGLLGPLARNINLCALAGCKGQDARIGNLCSGTCGCQKSDISNQPF